MKIIDNFLDQKDFDELQTLIMGKSDTAGKNVSCSTIFPWFYSTDITYKNEDHHIGLYGYKHLFYVGLRPESPFCINLEPVLLKLKPVAMMRIAAFSLPRTPEIEELALHVDLGDERLLANPKVIHTTSIFYVNTNNGYTKFEDGTKVESVANRIVTFPGNTEHFGATCTDANIRVVINFNYF